MDDIRQAIRDIDATPDLLEKALKLAGLVTRVFNEAGWELVVVGGSAVEFYTEGSYMSGDIDLCRKTLASIPLRRAQDLMGPLGATGGPRSWKVAGLYVDLLGLLENEARTPCRTIETPCGPIAVLPAELAIVERTPLRFIPGRIVRPETWRRSCLRSASAARRPSIGRKSRVWLSFRRSAWRGKWKS